MIYDDVYYILLVYIVTAPNQIQLWKSSCWLPALPTFAVCCWARHPFQPGNSAKTWWNGPSPVLYFQSMVCWVVKTDRIMPWQIQTCIHMDWTGSICCLLGLYYKVCCVAMLHHGLKFLATEILFPCIKVRGCTLKSLSSNNNPNYRSMTACRQRAVGEPLESLLKLPVSDFLVLMVSQKTSNVSDRVHEKTQTTPPISDDLPISSHLPHYDIRKPHI